MRWGAVVTAAHAALRMQALQRRSSSCAAKTPAPAANLRVCQMKTEAARGVGTCSQCDERSRSLLMFTRYTRRHNNERWHRRTPADAVAHEQHVAHAALSLRVALTGGNGKHTKGSGEISSRLLLLLLLLRRRCATTAELKPSFVVPAASCSHTLASRRHGSLERT